MASFAVEARDFEGARILALSGEIDARASRELQKELLACLAQGHRSLLVDLAGVDTVAAAGLRVLVAAGERLQAEGGALALCALPPGMLKVVETAGMDRTLSFHGHRDQALEWLRDTVRQTRLARLAGRLLRKKDESGRLPFGPAKSDSERSTLAVTLLAAEREREAQEAAKKQAASGGSRPRGGKGGAEPPR